MTRTDFQKTRIVHGCLRRESPFSFKCQICSACCHNKAIRVAPYEALRLARNLKITTTELYRMYAEEGGTVLLNRPDGSCIFLDSRGYGLHPDRPLVCRLFPLGQIMDQQGTATAETESEAATPKSLLSSWLDVDASVNFYCRQKKWEKPDSLEEWIGGL